MSDWMLTQMRPDFGPPKRGTVSVANPMGVRRGSIVRVGATGMFAGRRDPLYWVESVDDAGLTMDLVRLDPVRRVRSVVRVWLWKARRLWRRLWITVGDALGLDA